MKKWRLRLLLFMTVIAVGYFVPLMEPETATVSRGVAAGYFLGLTVGFWILYVHDLDH